MSRMTTARSAGNLLALLLLITSTAALSFNQYATVISLSRSLLARVADLRSSRGDHSGSARVRTLVDQLQRGMGLGFLDTAWSVAWGYFGKFGVLSEVNFRELYDAVPDVTELIGMLVELSNAESESQKSALVARNYGKMLRVSNRMICRLLEVFAKSVALREILEALQKEMMEGGLLQDLMEVGNNDLKNLAQIIKDSSLQVCSDHSISQEL